MSGSGQRISVLVTDVAVVSPLIKRFSLRAAAATDTLPRFSAGAHILVELQDRDMLWRNPYSLMGTPSDCDAYAIGVRRDPSGRGGSQFLHDKVGVGTRLSISYPVNLFPIDRRARKHLLIAGGIGITPLLAMVEQLSEDGGLFELHYAARSRQHAAFGAELHKRFPKQVHVYSSEEGERIDPARILLHQPIGTHLYVCGPPAMIACMAEAAIGLGWPPQSIHSERFTVPAMGAPYEVLLQKSNIKVRVGTHQSMLEAIEAAGVDAPFLCRGGACGECETAVLACRGVLHHQDHVLSAEEQSSGRRVMPCVSRFEGDLLVLDR